MDYAEELRGLLRPLGIYDVESGIGGAELGAIGRELTAVWDALETAEREATPLTAEDSGLAAWEALFPFVPRWQTTEDRRRAIAALLRIDGTGFTPAQLNAALAGCGIRAHVEESEEPMTVLVSFPDCRGEPEDFELLRWRIEQILPCHLDMVYVFLYVTWAEMEALFAAWSAVQAAGESWQALECTGGDAA